MERGDRSVDDGEQIIVNTLGAFSLRMGEKEITDDDNRSRRVWLLLAYMLYYRDRIVSQEELVDLLWGEGERSSNPANALKTMFYRLRAMLEQLSLVKGRTLILRREGGYIWNNSVPVALDTEEFERVYNTAVAEDNEERRLEIELGALDIYQGDFLPKLSSEPWVVPIAAYFHNLYLTILMDSIQLLEARGRYTEVELICRRGVEVEPHKEEIYQHLMQALNLQSKQHAAIRVYEEMSQLLYKNFGVLPSDETRSIYREATRTSNERALSISSIMEQIQEAGSDRGALYCEYDFFRIIYQAEARAVARSGDAVHMGLITVTDIQGQELPKRSLDRCMENLQSLICSNLRKGDVASRCSASQYILMLPQANYENSRMVCERIIKAFGRQYPHSPASLRYAVQPLEPNV